MVDAVENGARKLEHWPILRLVPYARNARTHSDSQVAEIAASIGRFGFNNPVLVDETGSIIAGHGRVLAAKRLGMDEVPVVVLSHLTDAERRAYILADNKLAEKAGWDEDLLRLELADLQDLDIDLNVIGFEDKEIDRLLAEEDLADDDADEAEADDAPPPPDAPTAHGGDVWLLGEHRVACGDSTSSEAVAAAMGGVLADMVFTDPPYNVAYNPDTRPIGGRSRSKNKLGSIKNDHMDDNAFLAFLQAVFGSAASVMRPGAAIYVCHADGEGLAFRMAFEEVFKLSSVIIWAKSRFSISRADYHWMHEPILYGWLEGAAHSWHGDRSQSTIWNVKNDASTSYVHPTQKPVKLIERALRNSTKRGDVVLDLFGGSGSTLIACERRGRIARLVELDPKYVDVIVRRWQDLTGQQARLEATGRTFAEVAAERATI
ncbi:MAG: site-specific DNA-methyltransferase [Pseudomonadota bacterium]